MEKKDKYKEILKELMKWIEEQRVFQRQILYKDYCVVPVEREEFRSGFCRAIIVIQKRIKELEEKCQKDGS